jgi:hypothetical protein
LQNSHYCKKSLNTDPFTIHLTLKHPVNCKAVALLLRQFLPKMYKSVGYLQNYPRTDIKRRKKNQYTFELIDWFFSCRSMLKRRVVITWSDIWRRFELLNILIKIHLHVYLCLILFLNFNKALIKNVLCTSISVDRLPFWFNN